MRLALALCFVLTACPKSETAPVPPKRATLRPVTATTFELIPTANQSPFCLAYTVTTKGVIRQLTMSEDGLSFICLEGKPIGERPYGIPAGEPSIKVLVLFTSEQVSASSVSQQLLDAHHAATLTAMDLRLPGQAALEVLDFSIADAGTGP